MGDDDVVAVSVPGVGSLWIEENTASRGLVVFRFGDRHFYS